MSEPPAILTLPAAVLAFLWASERERLWAWLVPGLLFGLTAMFRPEYLFVGAAFVVLAAIRVGMARGWRPGLAGAGLLVGGAAAADRALDDPQRRRARPRGADLDRQRQGPLRRHLPPRRRRIPAGQGDPGRALPRARASTPTRPRSTRSTRRRCSTASPPATRDLPRDSALGKIGKQNFSRYFDEDPLGYLAMTARKVGRMWSSGVGEAMSSGLGRAVQILIVALGLAGFVLLGLRRRWWELVGAGDPDRPRHRRRRRSRWRRRGATRC